MTNYLINILDLSDVDDILGKRCLKMKLDYFTTENTDGFTKKEIEQMNIELENAMAGYDEKDDFNGIMKNESEKIFKKFK